MPIYPLIARFMGPIWGTSGPRWAPCWPHELCYLGLLHHWPNYSTWLSSNIFLKFHYNRKSVTAYSISQEICTRFLLCCGYTLTDFPISIRLTSLALWQSNDCPSASKATLMNMDKYFMWIHYERLHKHNKAKHNKTVCVFLGIYCIPHYKPCFHWLNDNQNSFLWLVNCNKCSKSY